MPLTKQPYRRNLSAGKRPMKYTVGAARRISAAQKGYLRTGGYWGRYNRPSRMSPGEWKFFDTTATFGTVGAAGEIQASMCLIPQNITESGRIGRKCTVKRIDFMGDMILNAVLASANGQVDRVRVIVYHDKQANGATAAVLDLLETADILSFRNLANSGRFRILSDTTQAISCMAGAGDVAGTNGNWNAVIRSYKVGASLNMPLEFSGTTGAITELRSNNIGILAISEGADLTTFKFNCRVRYADS